MPGGKAVLLREAIYRALRRAILTCEFQPGQELREQILAERYRVSRSPVRDALLRLELENLITVLPRQGYVVRPISMVDAENVASLCLLLEPACAVAAAQRANDSALRSLDHFRGFADQDRSAAEYREHDHSFHHRIAELSENPRMAAFAGDLMEQFERLEKVARQACSHESVRRDCAEHDAIIEALQAHDCDRAARLCLVHARAAHRRVATGLRLLAAQNEPPAPQPAVAEALRYCWA